MTYSIELLKADITEELSKIQRLQEEFSHVEAKVAAEDLPNYDRGAIGYLLHNFYNGCESIFRSIALFFENDLGPETWHRDLLRRMKLEVQGYRPRVIDDELFRILDDFRGFRHKFRHSYAFELDWDRERLVALQFRKAHELLRSQVMEFLGNLEEIGQ